MPDWTLVTGASSGIGAEIARVAARDGHSLILTARRREALDALAEDCRSLGAPEARVIEADLSDEARVDVMWTEATTIGRIGVLINNAGLGSHGKLATSDWWRERQMLGVNVLAATLLLKHAVAHMVEHGGGRILNVTSMAGMTPCPNMAIYGASKAYLLSLSDAVREEMRGTDVSITALAPGFVATGFQADAQMEDVRAVKSAPMQSAEDVAQAAWKGLMAGRRLVVPGMTEKAGAAALGLLPSALGVRLNNLILGEGEIDPDSGLGRVVTRLDRAGERLSDTFSKERLADWRKRAEDMRARATAEGGPLDAMKKRFESTRDGLKETADGFSETAAGFRDRTEGGGDMNEEQARQMREGRGFVAALDQSGGSTPKALSQYGVGEDQWSNEDEMFDLIHQMRSRIVTSKHFNGDKIIGAILFEQTMDREFEGKPAPEYLWDVKRVVPFLKVDKGLEEPGNGVQMMKDMGDLEALLDRAKSRGIFGTKMRSVIGAANQGGIRANVAQQFTEGNRILDKGLVPILEPEITISIDDKADAERMLREEILAKLEEQDREIMLKLTLPEEPNFYRELIEHPMVMRVVALSGGYSQEEANRRLAENEGMTASFSRGLAEGLRADQSDEEFEDTLGRSIDSIYAASIT